MTVIRFSAFLTSSRGEIPSIAEFCCPDVSSVSLKLDQVFAMKDRRSISPMKGRGSGCARFTNSRTFHIHIFTGSQNPKNHIGAVVCGQNILFHDLNFGIRIKLHYGDES